MASERAASVEIRVHGIGDHEDWSALGSPPILVDAPGRVRHEPTTRPDIALPPASVGHAVLLVSWTRTSRAFARFLWYLAFPYTLANVAGEMRSASGRVVRSLHASFVVVTSLLLTVSSYVWILAILETALRFVPGVHTQAFGDWLAVVVGAVLIGGMWWRRFLRPHSRTGLAVVLSHSLVLVAWCALTVGTKPNRWTWAPPAWFPVIRTWGPSPSVTAAAWDSAQAGVSALPVDVACPTLHRLSVPYVDPTATVAFDAVVIAFLLSSVLTWVSLAQRMHARRSSSAQAAAAGAHRAVPAGASTAVGGVTLFIATLALQCVFSALRLAVDQSSGYLVRHGMLPGSGRPQLDMFRSRTTLAFYEGRCAIRSDWVIDLIPILGAVALLALVIAVFLVWLPTWCGRGLWAQKKHLVITNFGRRVLAVLFIAGTLEVVTCRWLFDQVVVLDHPTGWRWLVVAVQVLAIATSVVALGGRGFVRIRTIFNRIADVLGFWPVRWHPLSGASYRDEVVEGIRQELDRPRSGTTVLVGHSQGSVLSAWALDPTRPSSAARGPSRTSPYAGRRIVLVTCGCPLRSLYATYFPEHFDGAFMRRVAATVSEGSWVNFWRDTDPIATPSDVSEHCQVVNQEIPDPKIDRHVFAHGDYWVAHQQIDWIREQIAAHPGAPPT